MYCTCIQRYILDYKSRMCRKAVIHSYITEIQLRFIFFKNSLQSGKFSNPQISIKAQIIHLHMCALVKSVGEARKAVCLKNQSPDACQPSGTVIIICCTTVLTDQNTVFSHLLTDVAILRPPTGHLHSVIVTWINISHHRIISTYYIILSWLCISSQRNSPFLSVHSRHAYFYSSAYVWKTCIKLCAGDTLSCQILSL